MKVADLEASFDAAPPLSINDILLSSGEHSALNKQLIHCILRIAVTHGGESFEKFRAALETSLPSSPYKIELHQTALHPLPAFDIDESTIVGGAEVVDAIFNVLEVKQDPAWLKIARKLFGSFVVTNSQLLDCVLS